MHVLRRLVAVVAAALALAGAAVTSAHAEPTSPGPAPGIGIRLLEAPVALQSDPRAQTYIVDNLAPGTTITRKFEVANNTGERQTIQLYPGAATIAPQGGFVLEEGRAKNELTSWMSTTPTSLTLANGATGVATVRIAVPRDATETERYAVVWAEARGGPGAGGITTISRVGIRVYLSVGPGNGPPSDFEIGSVTPGRTQSGSPQLSVEITNKGGRALDPRGTVTLSRGPGGISAAPVDASGGSIAPGGKGTIVFPFDSSLPAGPWTAAVKVTSGTVTRDGSTSITFPDKGAGQSSSTDAGGAGWWAWSVVAVVAVVAVASFVFYVVRRRRSEET